MPEKLSAGPARPERPLLPSPFGRQPAQLQQRVDHGILELFRALAGGAWPFDFRVWRCHEDKFALMKTPVKTDGMG
jgi:hypothetical protein